MHVAFTICTPSVYVSDVYHRINLILLGGFFIPPHRFSGILRNAPASEIQPPKIILCGGVFLLGSEPEEPRGFIVILFDTNSGLIQTTQIYLCLCVATDTGASIAGNSFIEVRCSPNSILKYPTKPSFCPSHSLIGS